MLDFNKTTKSEQEPVSTNSIQVFYKTHECLRQLQEACQSEGLGAPSGIAFDSDTHHKQLQDSKASLTFIETDDDVEKLALSLCHIVSRNSDIVLIGQNDSIGVVRKLASLGFYYLLWPASRQDIVELIRVLQNDRLLKRRPQNARSAMRIAVVGTKGGCGGSLVAAELSRNLIKETSQPVVLADHSYQGSNLNIMLGQQTLSRKRVCDQILAEYAEVQTVDPIYAQSLLIQIQQLWSYLGIDSTSTQAEKLWQYSNSVLGSIAREHAFIVEDYPSSTKCILSNQSLQATADCLVVVISPTLSGLQAAKAFLNNLKDRQHSNLRTLLVINHSQPESPVSKKDIEEYLEQPIAVELFWYKGCEAILTEGNGLQPDKHKLGLALKDLTNLIIGKPLATENIWQKICSWCLS
ncbi:hypothetical protein [Parendozoicomonas sp. Alg238-R29]|uniref:AAA family ATPase n=1 Tax=Parendozoicomonas sp. Alg238-R29 TaxID=2993446 RepID=UPI00248F377B|nr:hypothetical protein [Parendozoicomonas sp. Alg238-R29]